MAQARPNFFVLVNREYFQFREAVRDSSDSLTTQLVLISSQLSKVGEVFRENKCSLVAVVIVAYVTSHFTDIQVG